MAKTRLNGELEGKNKNKRLKDIQALIDKYNNTPVSFSRTIKNISRKIQGIKKKYGTAVGLSVYAKEVSEIHTLPCKGEETHDAVKRRLR